LKINISKTKQKKKNFPNKMVETSANINVISISDFKKSDTNQMEEVNEDFKSPVANDVKGQLSPETREKCDDCIRILCCANLCVGLCNNIMICFELFSQCG